MSLAYQLYIIALVEFSEERIVMANNGLTIHLFGACVGFIQSRIPFIERADDSYTSTVVAALGTVFLFCYWPSFNQNIIFLKTEDVFGASQVGDLK